MRKKSIFSCKSSANQFPTTLRETIRTNSLSMASTISFSELKKHRHYSSKKTVSRINKTLDQNDEGMFR